uniref:Uncharacterized protein n=1 Tax=Noccaea caerulescens TaxID=107243 RepID=A0A1J3GNK1_NOCCA
MDVVLFPNKTWPETREYALISIHGEDAEEKAMQLSGSVMEGCKLVVVKAPGYIPQALPRVRRIPYGHTYPDRIVHPWRYENRNIGRAHSIPHGHTYPDHIVHPWKYEEWENRNKKKKTSK